jgi:hypothetical protein
VSRLTSTRVKLRFLLNIVILAQASRFQLEEKKNLTLWGAGATETGSVAVAAAANSAVH